jgi:hypothetical protein
MLIKLLCLLRPFSHGSCSDCLHDIFHLNMLGAANTCMQRTMVCPAALVRAVCCTCSVLASTWCQPGGWCCMTYCGIPCTTNRCARRGGGGGGYKVDGGCVWCCARPGRMCRCMFMPDSACLAMVWLTTASPGRCVSRKTTLTRPLHDACDCHTTPCDGYRHSPSVMWLTTHNRPCVIPVVCCFACPAMRQLPMYMYRVSSPQACTTAMYHTGGTHF